jgi:hypothetical protein
MMLYNQLIIRQFYFGDYNTQELGKKPRKHLGKNLFLGGEKSIMPKFSPKDQTHLTFFRSRIVRTKGLAPIPHQNQFSNRYL